MLEERKEESGFCCYGGTNVVEQEQVIDSDLFMGKPCGDTLTEGIHIARVTIKGRVSGVIRKNPDACGCCSYDEVIIGPTGLVGSIEGPIMLVDVAGRVVHDIDAHRVIVRKTAKIGGLIKANEAYVEEGFDDCGKVVASCRLLTKEPSPLF